MKIKPPFSIRTVEIILIVSPLNTSSRAGEVASERSKLKFPSLHRIGTDRDEDVSFKNDAILTKRGSELAM